MITESEIKAFFENYEAARRAKQHAKLAGFMIFPLEVLVTGAKKRIYDHQAQVFARAEEFARVYERLGIKAVKRDLKFTFSSTDDEAVVNTKEAVSNAEGDIIGRWQTNFLLKKSPSGTLQIASIDAREQTAVLIELGYPLQDSELASIN